MMDRIKRLLTPKTPAEQSMPPYVAVTALLVEAALVDGVYVNIESDMIAEILVEAFEFEADKADALLSEAEALAEEAVGSHQFTKHAKKLPMAERVKVIEAIYRVIYADGERSDLEDAYVRHVAGLLHVDDVQRAEARRRAEARTSGAV
ncbi:TerB family tellurite resistance protein [Hyphomonas sp. NPDC076900]|uniref:tellurite resistance TerB family protein n=1 Tax=unclassified Hyphomonas TaxID=2630699 RepID=UPI003D0759CB